MAPRYYPVDNNGIRLPFKPAAYSNGQCPVWNSVDGMFEPGASGGSPTGPAGGVLSGTYPNPGFENFTPFTVWANNTAGTAAPTIVGMTALAQSLGANNAVGLIQPRGYIDGMILANNGAGAQSLEIQSGVVRANSNEADISAFQNFFKSLAGTWVSGAGTSGAPVNGLDTGTVAASTWYHVWAICLTNGESYGNADYLFSLSATAPTLPASYGHQQRIGAVLTDGSKNIVAFHQYGDYFYWDVPFSDASGVSLTATVANLTVSAPLGIITQVFGTVNITNASVGIPVRVWSPQQGGTQPSNTGLAETQVTSVNVNSVTPPIATNTSSQLKWNSATGSSCGWITWGWIDPRGKNSTGGF